MQSQNFFEYLSFVKDCNLKLSYLALQEEHVTYSLMYWLDVTL